MPPGASPPLARRLAISLAPIALLVLPTFAIPHLPLDRLVPLDGALAILAVRFADSCDLFGLPFLSAAALALVITRPGLTGRRRLAEAGAMALVMTATFACIGLLNEWGIKPRFAAPRPYVIALTEAGALAPEVETPAEFYALGDRDARRAFLRPRLAGPPAPALAPVVREHWISEVGYSFPSGHSTASMAFASLLLGLSLVWLGGWRRRLLLLAPPLWALCVVYSRPLLRVHTPVDVTAGTLMGFGWGLLALLLVRWVADRLGGALAAQGAAQGDSTK